MKATFIGHPLARIVKPSMTRAEFRARFGFAESDRMVVLLPGSRHGEVARHMPYLIETVRLITARFLGVERVRSERESAPPLRFILALPAGLMGPAQIFGNQRAPRPSK